MRKTFTNAGPRCRLFRRHVTVFTRSSGSVRNAFELLDAGGDHPLDFPRARFDGNEELALAVVYRGAAGEQVAGACAPVCAMPVFGSAEAAPAEAAANDIPFRKSRRADCLITSPLPEYVLFLVMGVSPLWSVLLLRLRVGA